MNKSPHHLSNSSVMEKRSPVKETSALWKLSASLLGLLRAGGRAGTGCPHPRETVLHGPGDP